MATYTHKNAYLSFGGTAISDHVVSLSYEEQPDALENTAMGANSRTYQPGLVVKNLTFELNHDFASGEFDALYNALSPAYIAAIVFRPDAGSASTTNPEYSGNWMVTSYNPVNGSVGDLARVSVTCVPNGVISRGTGA